MFYCLSYWSYLFVNVSFGIERNLIEILIQINTQTVQIQKVIRKQSVIYESSLQTLFEISLFSTRTTWPSFVSLGHNRHLLEECWSLELTVAQGRIPLEAGMNCCL